MPSVHDIVDKLNESLALQGGSDIYGIGQSAVRGKDRLPGVVNKKNGEIIYVGIDDKKPIRLYHKLNSITLRSDPRKGYGNSTLVTNIYSLSMVVFNNRKKTKQYPDELSSLIQTQFPETVKIEPYQSINIFFNSVILNDLQVWQQEYSEDFRLPPEHNLFRIDYTVEATFLKGCFITCS